MAITQDFQYEFKGLLIGAGTPFVVEEVEGLLGPPDANTNDTDKAYHHGGNMGRHTLQPRRIQLSIGVRDVSDIEDRIDELVEAFTPSSARIEYPFTFQRPGKGVRVSFCRVTRGPRFISNWALARGFAQGIMIQMIATDPRIYNNTALNEVITLSSVASNSASLDNSASTWEEADTFQGSPPTITIIGPAVDPRIANLAAGNRSIKTNVTLTAGQELVIDVARRLVTLDDVVDYSVIPDDNQWWELMKGSNSITYSRTGTTGTSTATIAWRPAHMR